MREIQGSKAGRFAFALVIGSLVVAGSGCAGTRHPDDDPPRDRLGALPFPGTFTLYRVADPEKLGLHRYERPARFGREDEGRHGIVYTTRAGFLDVGHMRITIDHVRFAAERVRAAMRTRAGQVELPTIEGSTFFVTLRYPLEYAEATADDATEERVADEVAIRAGQRLAYLMMTWHEVITWFGWSTVRILPEQRSSFTWDDTMSHVVGLRVAGRALRDTSGRTFDEAVTVALRDELRELGAVAPMQTDEAVHAVEGLWWADAKPLKRHLDIGLSDGMVRPWLVRGLPFAPDAQPQAFHLPTLDDVFGRDFSGFFSVRIDPNIPEAACPASPRCSPPSARCPCSSPKPGAKCNTASPPTSTNPGRRAPCPIPCNWRVMIRCYRCS